MHFKKRVDGIAECIDYLGNYKYMYSTSIAATQSMDPSSLKVPPVPKAEGPSFTTSPMAKVTPAYRNLQGSLKVHRQVKKVT